MALAFWTSHIYVAHHPCQDDKNCFSPTNTSLSPHNCPPKSCAAGIVMLALRVKRPEVVDISYMAWKILHYNLSMRIKTSYLPQRSGSHFSCTVEQLNCFPFFRGIEGKGPCSNAQRAWISLFINCQVLVNEAQEWKW